MEDVPAILGGCAYASSVLAIAGARISDAALPLMSKSITGIPGDKSPISDRSSAVATTKGWCESRDGDSCDEDGCEGGICDKDGWL